MPVKAKSNKSPVPPDEWRERIYDLTREGMTLRQVAECLGISLASLQKELMAKPDLNAALEAGKRDCGKSSIKGFVMNSLSPEAQAAWEAMTKGAPSTRIMMGKHKEVRQEIFLHAFMANKFNYTEACKMADIDYGTYNSWCHNDIDFKKLVDEMVWHQENFIESAFIKLIEKGDSPAIIHAVKTRLRHRGYSEKITVEVQQKEQFDIDALPLDLRLQVLQHMRDAKRLAESTGDVQDAEIIPALPAHGEDQ